MAKDQTAPHDDAQDPEQEGLTMLDYNLEEVPDQTCAPEDEYRLGCHLAAVRKSKSSGKNNLVLGLNFPDYPEYQDFTIYIGLPVTSGEDKDEARVAQNKLRRLKEVARAFGQPLNGPIDPSAFVDGEAFAVVNKTEDPTYGEQNNIKQWLAAR